jgi:hypothetical protein
MHPVAQKATKKQSNIAKKEFIFLLINRPPQVKVKAVK